MFLLRALAYFFEEAVQSLWRSRLINALSIGTIAVSLFVLGAFLTVAANLAEAVTRWTQKVQVTFYLRDTVTLDQRAELTRKLGLDPAVSTVVFVSRDEALARFREMFRELASLPDEVGSNPFPAALEATVKPGHEAPEEVQRLAGAFEKAPGVEEVQYDLLWIERLATATRVVRVVGLFLGGILILAGVFTISNVIRLTVYARQDELDIMRLVGATQAYVKGPFVVEGMLQGCLGGLLAVGLLYAAFRLVTERALAASELLGRQTVVLPAELCLGIVVGGMVVGVIGSLVSLGRRPV